MLSDSYVLEKAENRKMLSLIISFLGRQGLALRGHQKKSISDPTEGGELDSNLTLTSQQKEYFSEVTKILKLILLMPATNVTSERSFSALRRLKTWLRTTQQRVNWCMILQDRKDKLQSLK